MRVSLQPPARRNAALVTVDIIVSVALLAFGAVLSLIVISYATLYNDLISDCGPGSYEGLQCNGTVLSAAVIGLIVVTVLAYFLAVGMVIVSLIRKRYTFWWPLGAVIIVIAAFYVSTWVVGMTVPA